MRGAWRAAIFLAACSAAAPRSAAPTGASPVEVRCRSGAVVVHVDRSCERDADCAIAGAAIDCCGTAQVVGIAAHEAPRWSEGDAPCGPSAGLCECLAEPGVADDGTRGERATVACRDRVCTTTFRTF